MIVAVLVAAVIAVAIGEGAEGAGCVINRMHNQQDAQSTGCTINRMHNQQVLDRQNARLTGASRCSSSSSRGSAGLVAAVMAVAIGEGAEGAVMFAIGKSRRVFMCFEKLR